MIVKILKKFLCGVLAVLIALCGGACGNFGGNGMVELYQLAPEKTSLMQSYVVKTKKGKLIVIDGGIDGTGRDEMPYLPAALRAIAGVGAGEYFEVEAWFLSHAHKDHFNELAKMLNAYTGASNFKIAHFYFDFPDFETDAYPYANADASSADGKNYLETLKMGLDNYAAVNNIPVQNGSYYEDINGAVICSEAIEKGLDIVIDGVRFEIMQTWDISDGTDINSNSLVLRMWTDGQSVLFLNDLNVSGGRRLVEKYGENLQSDIVQMAHHGQGAVQDDVYALINADVYLWATPKWVWNNTAAYTIGETRRWVNGGVDFTDADERNIVACLYDDYPLVATDVAEWAECKDGMKLTFPYVY